MKDGARPDLSVPFALFGWTRRRHGDESSFSQGPEVPGDSRLRFLLGHLMGAGEFPDHIDHPAASVEKVPHLASDCVQLKPSHAFSGCGLAESFQNRLDPGPQPDRLRDDNPSFRGAGLGDFPVFNGTAVQGVLP